MEDMQNQELCILLDSILALLETGNADKAKEIIAAILLHDRCGRREIRCTFR